MADSRISPLPGTIAVIADQLLTSRREKKKEIDEELAKIKDAIQQNKIPISSSTVELRKHNELLLFSKTKEMSEHLLNEYGFDIAYKDTNESKRTLLHNAVHEKATDVSREHLEFIMDKLSAIKSTKFKVIDKIVQPSGTTAKRLSPQLVNGNTPLHEVIQQGPAGEESLVRDYLQKMLQMGDSAELFSLNVKNSKKQTPLSLCAMRGDVALLKTLLSFSTTDKGSTAQSDVAYLNINCKDDRNWTPLHYAALHENPEFTRVLTEFGKDHIQLNEQNEMGRTPLLVALRTGNSETAKVLYENPETQIDVEDGNGVTALKYALNNEDKNKEFLEYFFQKIFEKEEILNIAIKEGHSDNVWSQLEKHDMQWLRSRYDHSKEGLPPSDINLNELSGGETILHRAACFGNTGLIEKKIDALKERNETEKELISNHHLFPNNEKKNPLHIASEHGHGDSLIKLIEYVFELNKTGDEQINPKAWKILASKDMIGDNFLQMAVKYDKMSPESIKDIFHAINKYGDNDKLECQKIYRSTDGDNDTLMHNLVQKGKHTCIADLYDRLVENILKPFFRSFAKPRNIKFVKCAHKEGLHALQK